jgi:hypothetical protein
LRQQRHPVPAALAVAHRELPPLEIQIFHPHPHTPHIKQALLFTKTGASWARTKGITTWSLLRIDFLWANQQITRPVRTNAEFCSGQCFGDQPAKRSCSSQVQLTLIVSSVSIGSTCASRWLERVYCVCPLTFAIYAQ